MAGNEDRGGVAELMQFIKTSKVPIVCICNDRQCQKLRSLAGVCFDLRFQRPRLEQVRAFALSVGFKEAIGEQLSGARDTLDELIVASNGDIRQVLHSLQMWASSNAFSSAGKLGDRRELAHSAVKDMTKLVHLHSQHDLLFTLFDATINRLRIYKCHSVRA